MAPKKEQDLVLLEPLTDFLAFLLLQMDVDARPNRKNQLTLNQIAARYVYTKMEAVTELYVLTKQYLSVIIGSWLINNGLGFVLTAQFPSMEKGLLVHFDQDRELIANTQKKAKYPKNNAESQLAKFNSILAEASAKFPKVVTKKLELSDDIKRLIAKL